MRFPTLNSILTVIGKEKAVAASHITHKHFASLSLNRRESLSERDACDVRVAILGSLNSDAHFVLVDNKLSWTRVDAIND